VILPDVNVLVYAHRADASDHLSYRRWLERTADGDEPFGLADVALAGFLRIVTHSRIFPVPTPMETALQQVVRLRERPNCVSVVAGE